MSNIKKAVISSVYNIKEKQPAPILAEFQNGKIQSAENFVCKRVTDETTKKNLILVADESTIYKSPIQENFGTSLTDSYIAIRNKKTNKIRLVQIEEASLKSTHYDALDEYQAPMLIDRNVALRDFGGKNAIRYLDRIKRMEPNVKVVSDILQKTIHHTNTERFQNDLADMGKEEEDSKDSLLGSIFPVINKNAKTVREKYPISNLISVDLLAHLKVVALDIIKREIVTVPLVNTYLKKCIKDVQLSSEPDSPENLEIVQICIYADGLIRLINFKKLNLDKAEISQISERVDSEIKEKFSQKNDDKSFNSKSTHQKAIFHYIVLILMTNHKNEVALTDVSENVYVPKTEFIKYAKLLGLTGVGRGFQRIKMTLDSGNTSNKVPVKRSRKKN